MIVLLVDNPSDKAADRSVHHVTAASRTESAVSLRRITDLMRQSDFRGLMLGGSALSLVTVSDSLLYLALQERMTIAPGIFPLLYVVTALAFMTFAIPAGRLADRLGPETVFVLGYALLAGVYGLLLLPWMNSGVAVLMLIGLGGVSCGDRRRAHGIGEPHVAGRSPRDRAGAADDRHRLGTFAGVHAVRTVWGWYGSERALIIFAGGLVAMLWIARHRFLRAETE